jgi:cyclophilin family peptidyl-prolyl cis-trans isomerase/HEAT repeat protein
VTRRGRHTEIFVVLACLVAPGCKSAPVPVQTPPTAVAPPPADAPLDKKVAWILRLEQQRVLHAPEISRPANVMDQSASGRSFASANTPDLELLALDTDPAVRSRAVLAIGRVGSKDGVLALRSALNDADDLVRSNAAFGLGLLGLQDGVAPLLFALKDPSLAVRGRAVEALGLIGQPAAAAAVADAASDCRDRLAAIEPDDEAWPKGPEIELCRLSLYALVRLRQFDALARVALNDQGQPVSRWWPVAFALQRINDKKAAEPLLFLAQGPGVYTQSFALRGLAAQGDRRAAPLALAAAGNASNDLRLRVAAVRALSQIGGAAASDPLIGWLSDRRTPPNLALEIVAALGAVGNARAFELLLDRWTDPAPAMRSAAIAAAARINPESFMLMVSSLDPDRDWSVRAALAATLATLPGDRVRTAVHELADDGDVRVRAAGLEALARLDAPDLVKRLFDALESPDFALRATAARLVGMKKPADGIPRLAAAYTRGESDATNTARAAALDALGEYGGPAAHAAIARALNDAEWPVRLLAADILKRAGDETKLPARPAPLRQPAGFFESDALLHPRFSPHAYLDTRYGTIEIELDVVEAPVTTLAFIELARAGFFDGIKVHRVVPNFVVQAGDPRGDGEGGPGYTLRDELSSVPYLRGTVGIALAGRDTGGSQFFVTVSPQPHLDAKYTVFGRVVKGMEVVDQVTPWDVIQKVRIWDGVR